MCRLELDGVGATEEVVSTDWIVETFDVIGYFQRSRFAVHRAVIHKRPV